MCQGVIWVDVESWFNQAAGVKRTFSWDCRCFPKIPAACSPSEESAIDGVTGETSAIAASPRDNNRHAQGTCSLQDPPGMPPHSDPWRNNVSGLVQGQTGHCFPGTLCHYKSTPHTALKQALILGESHSAASPPPSSPHVFEMWILFCEKLSWKIS